MVKPPTIQTVKRELDQFRKQLRPSRSRPKPSTGDLPKQQGRSIRGIKEGMNGGIVKSWITIKNPDGTVTTKQLGKSYYDPRHYLYEKGR